MSDENTMPEGSEEKVIATEIESTESAPEVDVEETLTEETAA